MATIMCRDIDVALGSSDPDPVPKLGSVTVPVVESVPTMKISSPPLSGQSSPVSSQTLAWGDAGDSLVPLSPNRVQAGRSQDVPQEGSLFHTSPVSPGLLLPTTLDDFSDSVLGDPITYVPCKQIPGSDAPLSWPAYPLPSGLTYMPDQSSVQTVLTLGTSSHPEVGPFDLTPPLDMEDGQLLAGCPYRFTSYSVPAFLDGNPAVGLQLHHPRLLEFVGAPESARLLYQAPKFWVDRLGEEQAMAAAVNLQQDAGIMLSNLQILSQFATSLHRMSSEMMVLGIGHMVFPRAEVANLSLAPRAARTAQYIAAMGQGRPQTGSGYPGPVPASTCNTSMTCQNCFPEGRLPP